MLVISIPKDIVEKASCGDMKNPDDMYPEALYADDRLAPPFAIRMMCEGCPVQRLCLNWAIENEEHGYWGGTSPYQRRQLRSERSRVHCPNCNSDAILEENRGEICLSCGTSWFV